MSEMIRFDQVSFTYGAESQLKDLSFSIEEGEFVVLTGASGSGKTTISRMINGLIPNFFPGERQGTVTILGREIGEYQSWEFGQLVGSVFQDAKSQFFTTCVRDEIAFCGENYGVPTTVLREKVYQIAKKLGISDLLDQSLEDLSSGEKQKVQLASALLHDPKILVLDEPSANLDLGATRQLGELLAQLKTEGKTIIVVEHRLHYLLEYADRVLLIDQGQLKQEYTPNTVLAMSATELSALGLREVSLFPTQRTISEKLRGDTNLTISEVAVSHKRFDKPILTDLTFQLAEGEIVALSGRNGVGKTTLAKAICGLKKTQRGSIMIKDQTVKAKKRLDKIWFAMQESDYQLFADSVWNEVLMTYEKAPSASARAQLILEELGLWQFKERHPATLSGGQKQRLTFAVALMKQPEIVLFDEPTSGLDGRNLERIIQILKRISSTDASILIITHDFELVIGACQRVLILSEDNLTEVDVTAETVEEIYSWMSCN